MAKSPKPAAEAGKSAADAKPVIAEAPELADIPWKTKYQFVIAVKSGLLAAQAHQAAKAANLPPPKTRRPLDLNNDDTFVQILTIAHSFCGVSQKTMAELNDNTHHTNVSRWIRGKHLPRPMYRAAVIQRLVDHVSATCQAEMLAAGVTNDADVL